MLSNLYAAFACSGSLSIFIWHWMCTLILFQSGSRSLIGSICLSYSLGLFLHKQFKVAPLSAIGYKFLTLRSWEKLILMLLIISLTLSRSYGLGLPYWFPPILLTRVVFSLWPSFLLWNVQMSWLMSTQSLWVHQYLPTSQMCLPFTHLGFACPCLYTGIPDPLLFTAFPAGVSGSRRKKLRWGWQSFCIELSWFLCRPQLLSLG